MLTVVAPASITSVSMRKTYSGAERVESMGENSTSGQYFFARATIVRAISRTFSLSFSSWCMMWMSELERKTWMRGCAACCTASQQASTSLGTGRAGDGGAAPLLGDGGDGLQVAGGRGREAGLDEVDPQPLQRAGDLQLLL